MAKNICPVVSRIPTDAVRRIDFDGHDLAHVATLYDDHYGAYAAALSAPLLATSDVFTNERIVVCDISAWDDVCRLDVKSRYRHVSA